MYNSQDFAARAKRSLPAALFLVSGAALVVHILVGLPLWITLPGGLALALAVLVRVGALAALDLRTVVLPGLAAGAIATLAYDVSRVAVVEAFGSRVRPFEAWRFFGQALVGGAAAPGVQWFAGALFHVTNGVAFAVAYTAWFGVRGVAAGIAWGLFLEAFMVGLYPGWLNIVDYGPFLAVSLLGHVTYGAVLGAVAKRLVLRTDAGMARR